MQRDPAARRPPTVLQEVRLLHPFLLAFSPSGLLFFTLVVLALA
jgi:hypothetical protein